MKTIRLIAGLAGLGLLAACGADDEPFEPTGSVSVGVNSNSGISTSARVGATNGSFTFGIGVGG